MEYALMDYAFVVVKSIISGIGFVIGFFLYRFFSERAYEKIKAV